MGSWQAKCELSGLGIRAGSDIVAVPCARGPYYVDAHVDEIYNWFPVGPGVYGTYDDYGGIDLYEGEKSVLQRLIEVADTVMGDTTYEERDRVRENLRGLDYHNGCPPDSSTGHDYGGGSALAVPVGYMDSVRLQYPRWMFMHREVFDFVRCPSPMLEDMLSDKYQRFSIMQHLLPPDFWRRAELTELETERILQLGELQQGMMNIHRSWSVTFAGPQFHEIDGVLAFNEFVSEFAPTTMGE